MYIIVSVVRLHCYDYQANSFNSIVLESGIYVSHIVWRIRYRHLCREAKMTGKSIDDLLDLRRTNIETTRDLESGIGVDVSGKTLHQEPTEQRPRSTSGVEWEKAS